MSTARTWIPPLVAAALAMIGVCARPSAADEPDVWVVDFRYAPADWQTSICLPDDWQKTLVAKDGSLLYDYPGPYGGFKLRITGGLGEGTEWVRQELHSPRVPVVRTVKRLGDVEITEEVFAVAPLIPGIAPRERPVAIERVGATSALLAWAVPQGDVDPVFADAAVGWGEPICYRISNAGTGEYAVVFGLCEGHHERAGQRVLDLRIEGETRATVDMAAEQGRNAAAVYRFAARDVDGDGFIDIVVAAADGSEDGNPVLNVLWVFPGGDAPPDADLLAGRAGGAYTRVACGLESAMSGPPRNDIIVTRLRNTGNSPQVVYPRFAVTGMLSTGSGRLDTRHLPINGGTHLTATKDFTALNDEIGVTLLTFGPLELAPGEERAYAVGVGRGPGAADLPESAAQAEELRDKAIRFWERETNLPYGRIEVPDPRTQALLDASIRNIYQAREIKRGEPAFQVGPTCYRGLWVVDGAFILEAVSFLGRTSEVQSGLSHYLDRQRPDGAIEFINGHRKETGIALWMLTRHARLTGDKKWLEDIWPHVERAFGYIQQMRRHTMENPEAPNAGLIPAGFSDGGLGGMAEEHTNVYWSLIGVRAAADAAQWLGKTETADAWDREYDDFYATFRRAAARDMHDDGKGNRYLPIRMTDNSDILPQKAQWGFCHAVHPGRLFPKDDPLVLGNLAMLRAVEKEGLVLGTGWQTGGIWTYFASFYAHAWLWQGDGDKAARILYAFANHASPLLCWREEQGLVGDPAAGGDMPHNWASAEFMRLVRDLLVLERGDELHLFEGMPAKWAEPGSTVRLRDVVTEFGPISLDLTVSDDGRTAKLQLAPPVRNRTARIVLHLDGWTRGGGTIDLPTSGPTEREIALD